MSELTLPRVWCSTGTKTDPGAAAALTGFVAGQPHSSAHHNHLLHATTNFIGQVGAGGLITTRPVNISPMNNTTRVLTTWDLSTYGVQVHGNQEAYSAIVCSAYLASLGSAGAIEAKGVAQNSNTGGRIAIVADSTTPLAYSDNRGASWTTVATANAFGGNNNAQDIGKGAIWGACVNGVTNAIYSSATAAASSWTSRSLNGTAGNIPMRIVGSPISGRALVVGVNAAGTGVFCAESADGITWANATIPVSAVGAGVGNLGCAGDIAYDPVRERFWWLTHTSNGISLHYSSTSSALSWTTVYTKVLGIPEQAQSMAVDPLLGIVYILAAGILGASCDGGQTWVSCSTVFTGVGVAPGLLIALDEPNALMHFGPFLRGVGQGNF